MRASTVLHNWIPKLVGSALARPRRWLGAVAAVTLVLGVALRNLEIRTDGAALYPPDHPTVRFTAYDRTVFDEDDEILVLITCPRGSTYFATRTGLRDLKSLHDSIIRIPGVNAGRVRSVASILDPQPGMPWVSIPCFSLSARHGSPDTSYAAPRNLVTGTFLSTVSWRQCIRTLSISWRVSAVR